MSFLHGSDWSCTTSCRQDTFLVSHGIVPECLLHSNRQLNSSPRLSGQIRLFLRKSIHSSDTFHHSSESKNRYLSYLGNVLCLGEYGNCLITNLSPRSQTKLFHTDSSHPVCICFCRATTRKSSPSSLTLVPTSFALVPDSQPIVDLFHLQTRCSSLSLAFCTIQLHALQSFLNNLAEE